MACPFTTPNQQQALYCFLSPLEEHEHLIVHLNNTILFSATNGTQPPSREALNRSLCFRYGGQVANWSLVEVLGGFLVKIPDWITQDNIKGDADFWEHTYRIILLPWQTLIKADSLPFAPLADITIHNFPVDFWHPFYFRQAVAPMGTLTGISELCLRRLQKSKLQLRIQCCDVNLILFTLFVGHGNQWSKCKIDLQGRSDQGDDHHPPPQPPPHKIDRSIEDGISWNEPHLPQPPYISPRRRAQQDNTSPAETPWRRGIPVAHAGGAYRCESSMVHRYSSCTESIHKTLCAHHNGPLPSLTEIEREEVRTYASVFRAYEVLSVVSSSNGHLPQPIDQQYSSTQKAFFTRKIILFVTRAPLPIVACPIRNKGSYTPQQVTDTCPILYPLTVSNKV